MIIMSKSIREERANRFLKDTGTTFKAKYLKRDYHFVGDNEKRDIYRVTLRREGSVYNFNFGQSLSLSDGLGGSPPSPYDVLACITKDDPGDFEDFCSEYGYDLNSRQAEKIYKAAVREWESIERLFGDVLEELREID